MIRNFSLAVLVRSYAKCANATKQGRQSSSQHGPSVFCTRFLDSISIACSKPESNPISTLTLLFKVGSRHETGENLGLTHFLRAATIMSGRESSGFIRSRSLQQQGAYLTCSSSRQYMAYTLCAPRPVISQVKGTLLDVVFRNCFPDWEMEPVRELVRGDLKRRHPRERVVDLVQKAAFSGSLSNSTYCEKCRINDITGEAMSKFINCSFEGSLGGIAACGIPMEDLIRIAEVIHTSRSDKPPEVPQLGYRPRGGYEYYDTGPGSTTYIAFAVEGVGMCNFKACLTYAILASALGNSTVTEGQHTLDRSLQKPIGDLSGSDPRTRVSAFHIPYADTGCFVILAKTSSEKARSVGFKTAEFFYNISEISQEQIQAGKKRLQVDVALQSYKCMDSSLDLSLRLMYKLPYDTTAELIKMIEDISKDDVMSAAKEIAEKCRSRMAMAVVGDVDAAPHDAELRIPKSSEQKTQASKW